MGMRGLTESLPPGLGALGPRGSACPGDKSPGDKSSRDKPRESLVHFLLCFHSKKMALFLNMMNSESILSPASSESAYNII